MDTAVIRINWHYSCIVIVLISICQITFTCKLTETFDQNYILAQLWLIIFADIYKVQNLLMFSMPTWCDIDDIGNHSFLGIVWFLLCGIQYLKLTDCSCMTGCYCYYRNYMWIQNNWKCGPMPNVMVTLPNIGGALCSTPQSLADAQYWSAVQ